ncbi:hypothetical protein C8J56DRAFT_799007, partial [Mycena floridula]
KLNIFYKWCADNFLLLNRVKTVICAFNKKSKHQDKSFFWGPEPLKEKTDEVYVGVPVCTTTTNIFEKLYHEKTAKARYCAHRIFGLEGFTGKLTPRELKRLYMARVDSHLIAGFEDSPDATKEPLNKLENVQVNYIRYMLGLPGRSMKAPLYTETGLTPLRMRRLKLTLGYVRYLLSLKLSHYAGAAFRDSLELARRGKTSWAKDLQKAIQKMPFMVPVLPLIDPTDEVVKQIIDQITKGTEVWLQQEVDKSVKLYLIQGRLEPEKDKPPAQKTLLLRHYLYLVTVAKHRRALTSIIVGNWLDL